MNSARLCDGHSYSESVHMGNIAMPEVDVLRLLNILSQEHSIERDAIRGIA